MVYPEEARGEQKAHTEQLCAGGEAGLRLDTGAELVFAEKPSSLTPFLPSLYCTLVLLNPSKLVQGEKRERNHAVTFTLTCK